jgi:hypothetical protein
MAWSDPSPFRATLNPSREHFDPAMATELVAKYVPSKFDDDGNFDDACEFTDCICLDRYATFSPDALAVLSEREWFAIHFGITELTLDAALAIRTVSSGLAYFNHIEYAHPEALSILLTDTKLNNFIFHNLLSIDPRGMEELNLRMSGKKTLCTVSMDGMYVIDEPVSRALLAFPLDFLSLKTDESLKAVTPNALSILQQATTKEVTINPGPLSDIQINAWPHEWSS